MSEKKKGVPANVKAAFTPPNHKDVVKDVLMKTGKQETLDNAARKGLEAAQEIGTTNPEKYKNEDLIKRLVAFCLSVEQVAGKSPVFVAERFAACMNATAPHVTLDRHQKKGLDKYVQDWMTIRERV